MVQELYFGLHCSTTEENTSWLKELPFCFTVHNVETEDQFTWCCWGGNRTAAALWSWVVVPWSCTKKIWVSALMNK